MFTRQVTRGERDQGAQTSSLAEESLHSIGLVKAHGYEGSENLRFQAQIQLLAELSYLKVVGYAVGPSACTACMGARLHAKSHAAMPLSQHVS